MAIISSILSSGYTTIIAAILAVVVGFKYPDIGHSLEPFSQIYLTLISITVLPIIFASVTASIVNLFSQKTSDVKVSRIVVVFFIALLASGVIGILSGIYFDTGGDILKSPLISDIIFKDVQKSIPVLSLSEKINVLETFKISDFLTTLLPKNPFEAFAQGNVIQILMISIFIGISIAALDIAKRKTAVSALNILMSSFKSILKIPAKILPIGIFCLLASSFSKISIDVLLAMKMFCIAAVACFLAIIILAFILLYIYSPIGLIGSIRALKEPITVAFSTCSNQATLPFLSSSLIEKFSLREDLVNLALPLGITTCRVSSASYFAFVTVFIASLYNTPLGIDQYIFIAFGAILSSLAASGASGVVSITMISIVLGPLGLPLGSILVILIIVDSIIDPIRTSSSLIMNAALSCAIINKNKIKMGKAYGSQEV